MRILLTQLALIESRRYDSWVLQHRRPRFLGIGPAACRLLADKVKPIVTLFFSDLSTKAGQRFVNGVISVLPCAWIEVPIHSRATSKRAAHGGHDTDLGLSSAAVTPESKLLITLSEVNVGDQIEVGTCGNAFIMHSDKDSSGPRLASNNLADCVAVVSG